MTKQQFFSGTMALVLALACPAALGQSASSQNLQPESVHLRASDPREWSEYPKQPAARSLQLEFAAEPNPEPWTLSVRQRDVKQTWTVSLNGTRLGTLVRDESDLISDFEIPAGRLTGQPNRLEIAQTSTDEPDDVDVGPIVLHRVSPQRLRTSATIEVAITDKNRQPMAGRITVVDEQGTLVPLAAEPSAELAIREGVIYTSNGHARFGVAPGDYRIFAGRGVEFGIDSATVRIASGQHAKRTLVPLRQLDTAGWISCDTHIHTLTHSGHGDATVAERLVTLAAEGLDLAIVTEHNKHVDYWSNRPAGMPPFPFTAVIGNEVTTRRGHFNIFPVRPGAAEPDHTLEDWSLLFDAIYAVPDVRVSILNHPRDLHAGFRPLAPRHHVSLAGENLDGRPLLFNAMEIINSGAVQSDPMELFGDWCGLINRGLQITPVGSSDSHDVTRFIVGQGRTYIRYDAADRGVVEPDRLDVSQAVKSFVGGKVSVSYGLLADVTVAGRFGPGELAQLDHDRQSLLIEATLQWPHWVQPESLTLCVAGEVHQVDQIDPAADETTGGTTTVRWELPKSQLKHDTWVCVVGRGGGVEQPYWPTAKPYQPDSSEFRPYTFALTGAVRIDGDGNGRYSSAYEYAHRLIDRSGGELDEVFETLAQYDRAVAIQAAAILWNRIDQSQLSELLADAPQSVRSAFLDYRQARRQSIAAQLEQRE